MDDDGAVPLGRVWPAPAPCRRCRGRRWDRRSGPRAPRRNGGGSTTSRTAVVRPWTRCTPGRRRRGGPEEVADALAGLDVAGVQAELGQAPTRARDRRGVGPAVVVQDDEHPAAGVAEVVERLVGHAPGEGAVTDHGHHPAVVLALELRSRGDAVGVAEGGRGVAVLDPVVRGLGPVRVAGKPPACCKLGEAVRLRSRACGRRPGARCPTGACRRGESKTRWRARVSSTTPRLEPRWPPVP